MTGRVARWANVALGLALVGPAGCQAEQEPWHFEIAVLQGDAYTRGYQHGERFGSRIRSVYAGLLTNSILPYLNRQRADIASVMKHYSEPEYDDGRFSALLMLESARNMERFIPDEYIQEMHGIADGSGISYDEVLTLNTFTDTMLGFRSMTFFINAIQAPSIVRIEFDPVLDADGVDNDGDGEVDEVDEHIVAPYDPKPHATMVEVPPDRPLKIVLKDQALMAIPEGPDPGSIRLQLDKTVFEPGASAITTSQIVERGVLEVEASFLPDGGFPRASSVSLLIQAGDKSNVTDPPPAHARFMRDERITFTTKGYGKAAWAVPNRGEEDGRTQPTSLAVALRGSATIDGAPLLGHHYALLDSNTSHKHTVLFVHRPTSGRSFAVVGWTGILGGFSGMNAAGLAYAINNNDSMDNPMTQQVYDDLFDARLLETGVPVTMMGRAMVEGFDTAAQAEAYLRQTSPSYGWAIVLNDAAGDIRAVEMDCNFLGDPDGGVYAFAPDASDPDNLDEHGMRWSSIGDDDLEMASHAVRNTEDIHTKVLSYEITPQRYWTSFYFRSLRTYFTMRSMLEPQLGRMDAAAMQGLLGTPVIVDERDSMNAAVYEPTTRRIHVAAGKVPATDAPWVDYVLAAEGP